MPANAKVKSKFSLFSSFILKFTGVVGADFSVQGGRVRGRGKAQ